VQRARIALLGPLVSINNPVRVAEEIAMLDQLSRGRLMPHLRFLLDGPVPGPAASSPKTIAHIEESKLADATPFGMGRMLFAGSPDTVVERLRVFQSLTGVGVVDLVFSSSQIPVEDERRSIELFGREVLPRIHSFAAA
jgi:alkanesulfonate monooxygenase SsuD/methylene tetrahydromethanopterin reductase-like flavin-dependent oxidoreductase (luciferase family)